DPPDHAGARHLVRDGARGLRGVPAPQRDAPQAGGSMSSGGFWHLLPNASTNARPLDELWWTMVGLCVLVAIGVFVGVFVWSLTLYARSRTPPANAETIYVVAKQWMWEVQHPGGQREIDTLHVP